MQNDYRQWPNILKINEEIKAIGLKISEATDQYEILGLRHKLAQLNSKRFDQIQFNKAMAQDDRKAA